MAAPQERLGYVDPEYLRLAGAMLEHLKQASYTAMHIGPGSRVLDVGCGPGTDTLPLAKLVGSGGEVVGVDYDTAMVEEAQKRAEAAGVNGWVRHDFADATALPFEDGHFDACRSERVFQHVPNRRGVLAEMARATRYDGYVVVADTDWGSLGIDCEEVDIERRFMRFFVEGTHHHGYSGRELYRLFKEQKLLDVSLQVFPMVFHSYALLDQIMTLERAAGQAVAVHTISEEERQRWLATLQEADAAGTFMAYCCLVLAVGRKG
jgi:ubiquinone/menaquinone biosynthesis C-methylase UbiE